MRTDEGTRRPGARAGLAIVGFFAVVGAKTMAFHHQMSDIFIIAMRRAGNGAVVSGGNQNIFGVSYHR